MLNKTRRDVRNSSKHVILVIAFPSRLRVRSSSSLTFLNDTRPLKALPFVPVRDIPGSITVEKKSHAKARSRKEDDDMG